MFTLAANPELVDILRQEATGVTASHKWSKASMSQLTKLDSFLRENMRFYSFTPCLCPFASFAERSLTTITSCFGTHCYEMPHLLRWDYGAYRDTGCSPHGSSPWRSGVLRPGGGVPSIPVCERLRS